MPPAGPSLRSLSKLLILGSLHMWLAGYAQAQTPPPVKLGDDALLQACEQMLACKSHLERATQLYKQEQYTAALDEYQAAYILQPYPLILYNIARLHHKQSHLADAVTYYQRYLNTGSSEQAERARLLLDDVQMVLREPAPAETPLVLIPPAVRIPSSALVPPLTAAVPQGRTPIYKKWWLWTAIGLAAGGVATAVGIGVYASGPDISGLPSKTLGFGK